jgi:hypothetical protein
VNFAGNRCIPAKWRFDRIRPAFPPWRKAVTVGVTAATSVVVMNAKDHGGRHQPDLGDDGRATAVTISDTKQTGARW